MTDDQRYATPEKGSTDWHQPLNSNFKKLERHVEVRDQESQLDTYEPRSGAKFVAIDTGNIYLADGEEWSLAPIQSHDHDQLAVEDSFVLPTKSSDPESVTVGELWYRSDTDEVKVGTEEGPRTLGIAQNDEEDTESPDPASDPYVVIDFEDTDYQTQFTHVDEWNNQNRQLVSNTREGGTSLRIDMDEGEHWGTMLRYLFGDDGHDEPDELYARYHVYFPSDFEAIRGGGKLPGPAGRYGEHGTGGNPSDGTNGWTARGGFEPVDRNADPSTVPIQLSYYVYHADMDGIYGDRFYWDGSIERGRWYQIDQHLKLNTPGENDAVLEAWVDGEQVCEVTDLRFRNEGYEDIKIESYWLTTFYGGDWTSPTDNSIFFDELTLSPSPIQ